MNSSIRKRNGSADDQMDGWQQLGSVLSVLTVPSFASVAIAKPQASLIVGHCVFYQET
jgi:hypothetical protein